MADKKPPRIGLTMYGRNEENRVSLPVEYVVCVRRAGGIPVLLPPGEEHLREWLTTIDAMILPGGGDISPATWGGNGHEDNYNMDVERDRDELALARIVVETGVPTLAICRGMQVVNVAFGGSLIEHLPDVVGETVLHRSADRGPIPHRVEVTPGSRLADVLGETEIEPASLHHQAVSSAAPGFDVVAHAPDGTIEAMERRDHPWFLAVQWHPELTATEQPGQQRLFDGLVRAAMSAAGNTSAGGTRAGKKGGDE